MSRIGLYILREAAIPFFAILGLGVSLLVVNRLLKVLPWLFEFQVPFWELLSVLLYLVPSFLIYALPIAMWVAWMVAYGRLGGDGELAALASVGAGPGHVLRSAVATGVVFFAGAVAVSQWGYGQGRVQFQQGIADIARRAAGKSLQPGNVIRAGDALWVAAVEGTDGQRHVYLAYEPDLVLAADEALAAETFSGFTFSGGVAFFRDTTDTTFAAFTSGSTQIEGLAARQVARGARELSLRELWQQSDNTVVHVELHQRLALSFALFLAPLAAYAAAPRRSRSGKGRAGLLAMLGFLVYYGLFTAGKQAALKGWVPPAAGLWFGNAFLLVTTMLAIRGKLLRPGLP